MNIVKIVSYQPEEFFGDARVSGPSVTYEDGAIFCFGYRSGSSYGTWVDSCWLYADTNAEYEAPSL